MTGPVGVRTGTPRQEATPARADHSALYFKIIVNDSFHRDESNVMTCSVQKNLERKNEKKKKKKRKSLISQHPKVADVS